MNLRQTAEVATLIATSASHIVDSPQPIPAESIHGYWKQSRTRLRCWFAALRAMRTPPDLPSNDGAQGQTGRLLILCREILVAEMLTRVWSTVLVAADRQRQTDAARAAVDAVYRGHLEARHEVLLLLADDGVFSLADQISLDRFRRRIERWTDALLGPLVASYRVTDFAFDVSRAEDFAESALHSQLRDAAAPSVPFLLAGVAVAFPRSADADRERAVLSLAIMRSMLAAFPREAFVNDGRLKTATHGQLDRSSRKEEGPPPATNPATPHPPRTGGLSFLEIRRRSSPEKE